IGSGAGRSIGSLASRPPRGAAREMIETAPLRDPIEPAELRACRGEAVAMPPQAQKSLLQRILGRSFAAQDAPAASHDERSEPAVGFLDLGLCHSRSDFLQRRLKIPTHLYNGGGGRCGSRRG